jgi:hypothetical protein
MDPQKLAMAKAIMDRNSQMDRGGSSKSSERSFQPEMQMEEFDIPQAKYNIPQEFLGEAPRQQQMSMPSMPMNMSLSEMASPTPKQFMNKPYPKASEEAIKNSKLPDAIKRLMIEHPIEQPGVSNGVTLTDDLVEKASRLMGTKRPQINEQSSSSQQINSSGLREMMKDVVREVLKENGLIAESVEKSNDNFKFQVGKHLFEGKLTKIKKLS